MAWRAVTQATAADVQSHKQPLMTHRQIHLATETKNYVKEINTTNEQPLQQNLVSQRIEVDSLLQGKFERC